MSLYFITMICSLTSLSQSKEYKFPDNFKFGVATSSVQIEGAWNVDGRGVGIWDTAGHNRPGLIEDGSNADVACDSYNKWEEDIEMVKNLGVDYYRFSLSWSRLYPHGHVTKVNQAGIDYYNKIINKLIENGIEPVVTLYHWDLPEVFTPLGGWTNPIVVEYFSSFSRRMFEFFGDRVRTWITINEPRLICQMLKGLVGDVTPDFPLGIAEYLCVHNILKAHGEVYHIYDKEFRSMQKGKIGITLDLIWWEPENINNPEDVRVAEQNMQFDFGLYANPIFNFDFPKVIIDRVAERSKMEGFPKSRLPKLTHEEKVRIHGTYDFLGINHYITFLIRANEEPPVSKPNTQIDSQGERFFDPKWEATGFGPFKVVPIGLRSGLKWIKANYGNPEIIITENGYADDSEVIEDDKRINYFRGYLNATLQAILEDDVNVRGYTAWTLMDDFEWLWGYKPKFGLYHVNFTDPNRTRTPKKSVEYIKSITKTRTI